MAKSDRWDLSKFDSVKNQIKVLDRLSNREKSFHVPNSTHAILKADALYVSTSENKIMRIFLQNGARRILALEDYKSLNV